MSEYDTAFSLPSVDDDPDTELGVLLMGLGPERLLAGLGAAGPDDDPATVTLLVDQLRHGVRGEHAMTEALATGGARWRRARRALLAAEPAAPVRTAALRRRWETALATVRAAVRPSGRAELVYLAACWQRRDEIDRLTEDDSVTPGLPS
ncbi:DUF6187 family protein [Actinophytocola gossypii]|uniref:Uncharacterized protein n=1 Tax=Actinophytocola gossypii TaxID=2812003 RepID=A0ABT2J7A3_9PSEU|nr:DUF6187 family protein [Actinophytocola gossypii]MCT2583731.1 hypothetical protein [Actinophytocola gossypii]